MIPHSRGNTTCCKLFGLSVHRGCPAWPQSVRVYEYHYVQVPSCLPACESVDGDLKYSDLWVYVVHKEFYSTFGKPRNEGLILLGFYRRL